MSYCFDDMVEIKLNDPKDFLIIKETLSRIGIASRKDKTLFQSCHILHKKGRYAIAHFKELFALDGKSTDFSESDLSRRNTIINLLEEWKLLTIVTPELTAEPTISISHLKIIPFSEKSEWTLVPKYNVGKRKNENKDKPGDI